MTNIMMDTQISRRAFLSTTGALVVSLAAPGEWSEASANTLAARPPLTGDQISSYITVEPDGSVVAYYGKIDGGQGLGTAIAQTLKSPARSLKGDTSNKCCDRRRASASNFGMSFRV